jgi:hypothetical protein
MLRTASTGEMVLIQFFEDKANRELILDHLYEKFPQITSCNTLSIIKQTILYMIRILNYTRKRLYFGGNGRFKI